MKVEEIVKTYESTQLNRVLEESLHPGGLDLTGRMAEVAGIDRTACILDVGCGRGTSTLFYTRQYKCRGIGADLSPASIAIASERCVAEGLADMAHFMVAGACQLPYAEAEFDVVFCECTMSLIADKAEAFREIARVVRPGGRILLSDVVLKHRLSDSFKQEIGFSCCFTEALTLEGYQEHALNAGLHPILVEDHSKALKQTAYRVSVGYGSLEAFWSQFGQGKIPCCNSEPTSSSISSSSGGGWKAIFTQGKPGYWLLAWKKPEG